MKVFIVYSKAMVCSKQVKTVAETSMPRFDFLWSPCGLMKHSRLRGALLPGEDPKLIIFGHF